jgi:hypothetical protein
LAGICTAGTHHLRVRHTVFQDVPSDLMRYAVPMFWLLTLLACAPESATESGPDAPIEWTGGDFWFYTLDVDDQCFGGALGALFMPNGTAVANQFEYPIYLPGFEELPYSGDISLRDPFMGMPVNIDEGADGGLEIRGSIMENVRLGAVNQYGDCMVTMTVDADLKPIDTDTASGTAGIAVSNMNDDPLCPVLESADCSIDLVLEARRQDG